MTKDTVHATAHCPITIAKAHPVPSSLRTDAMAATHGVYSRQKTSSAIALTGVRISIIAAVPPKRTDIVETTLSFAIKPVTSAVEILQSSNHIGVNSGAIYPEITARMLSCESFTTFM